jgi:hypothetical protein
MQRRTRNVKPPLKTTTVETQIKSKDYQFPAGQTVLCDCQRCGKNRRRDQSLSFAVIGVAKTIEMPIEKYDAACEWAGKKADVVDTATGEIETETPLVGE